MSFTALAAPPGAWARRSLPYGGKTGTAQVIGIAQGEDYEEDELAPHLRDHGLFLSSLRLSARESRWRWWWERGSGSTSAAPIARQVMDYYLTNDSKPEGGRLMAGLQAQSGTVN